MNPDRATVDASGRGPATWIARVEYGVLTALLIWLVMLGLAQILWRNLGGGGLEWADPMMRYLVLWITMLAGVRAAAVGGHLKVGVLERRLDSRWQARLDRAISLVCALICAALALSGLEIIRLELEFGDLAFLNVPRWVVLAIIPAGFALMTLRFVWRALVGPQASTTEGAH